MSGDKGKKDPYEPEVFNPGSSAAATPPPQPVQDSSVAEATTVPAEPAKTAEPAPEPAKTPEPEVPKDSPPPTAPSDTLTAVATQPSVSDSSADIIFAEPLKHGVAEPDKPKWYEANEDKLKYASIALGVLLIPAYLVHILVFSGIAMIATVVAFIYFWPWKGQEFNLRLWFLSINGVDTLIKLSASVVMVFSFIFATIIFLTNIG